MSFPASLTKSPALNTTVSAFHPSVTTDLPDCDAPLTSGVPVRVPSPDFITGKVKLNDSKTGEPSMMDMLNQFSGYNSPSALEV